ncbi:MAG TPA: hypothetical protein PK363_07010 [Giesbergeria sp.]|nr:hypothetical protein [Giesbergeria sp.]
MSFAAIAGPIAGAVVGGLMSDGGEQQTATKEPWSAAAPWLRQQLEQGQNLQAYYQQNPWNNLQQTAYQNTFSDIDNFRNSIAPGLMGFANRLMGTNYSRGGTPQRAQGVGLMSGGQSGGPFSVAPSRSYGLLDFKALNPYNNALKPAEIKQPTQQTIEEAIQAELERRQRENQYSGSARDGGFA